MSRRSLAGSWILFCALRKMMPSMPGFLPSSSKVWRYWISRSSPSHLSSTGHEKPLGIGEGLLYGGRDCSSAILRKSRKVSCST